MSVFNHSGMALLFDVINRDNPDLIEPVSAENCFISDVASYVDPMKSHRNTQARVTYREGFRTTGNIVVYYQRVNLPDLLQSKSLELDFYSKTDILQSDLEEYIQTKYGLSVDLNFFSLSYYPIASASRTFTASAINPLYTGSFVMLRTKTTPSLSDGLNEVRCRPPQPAPKVTRQLIDVQFNLSSSAWRSLPANVNIGKMSNNGYGLRNGMYIHRFDVYPSSTYFLILGLADTLGSNAHPDDYPDRIVVGGHEYVWTSFGTSWSLYATADTEWHDTVLFTGNPATFELFWDKPQSDLYHLTYGIDFSKYATDLSAIANNQVISAKLSSGVMSKIVALINTIYSTNYTLKEDNEHDLSLVGAWVNHYATSSSFVTDADKSYTHVIVVRTGWYSGNSKVRGYFYIHYNR